MTNPQNTQPTEGEARDLIFTATGGEHVTITATYQRTWNDEIEPCIGVDEVCAILDAWTETDQHHRHSLWPSTERSDDDVFIAYLRHGRLTLDRWGVATESDTFSLAVLPGLLPSDHYTLAEAPHEEEDS
jgi:hypothetical protein